MDSLEPTDTSEAPDSPAPEYTVTDINGRYPRGIRFDRDSFVASVESDNGQELRIRLDDRKQLDFWLEITIQRSVRFVIETLLDSQNPNSTSPNDHD